MTIAATHETNTATPDAPSTTTRATRTEHVPGPPGPLAKTILATFVAVPLLALIVGVPIAATRGWVSWADLLMLAVCYYVAIHGITIGYHRMFTHRSFKAGAFMRAVLAIAGSTAIQGRVVDWVADHRKHHQYSDKEQDPHSPWAYGTSPWAIAKGLGHAHIGWIFTYGGSDTSKYAPDLIADRTTDRVSRWWPAIAVISLGLPALIGWFIDGTAGAVQAFFWASLVRVALVHHMTWSINSLCHVWGKQPFESRDKATNLAWFAPFSGGESWHNYHHADPTSARHGVLPGHIDTSAILIRGMEKLGWISDVRWPSQQRIKAKLTTQ